MGSMNNKECNRDDLSTAAVGVRGSSAVDAGVHCGRRDDARGGLCAPLRAGVRFQLTDHPSHFDGQVFADGATAAGDLRAHLPRAEPLDTDGDYARSAWDTAWFLIIIGLLALAITNPGCERQAPSPAAVSAPPAPAVPSSLPPPGYEIEHVERRTYEGGTFTHTQEGAGTGAGLSTAAADVAMKFKATEPKSTLFGASGGATTIEQTLTSQSGKTTLILAGIVFLAGAGAAVYFKRFSLAAASAGVGGICLLVAFYPAVLIWALVAGVVVLLGALLTNDATRNRLFEALRATAAGVEDLPDGQRQNVKLAIAAHADHKDEQVIAKIKAADKLLTESARRRARAGA